MTLLLMTKISLISRNGRDFLRAHPYRLNISRINLTFNINQLLGQKKEPAISQLFKEFCFGRVQPFKTIITNELTTQNQLKKEVCYLQA